MTVSAVSSHPAVSEGPRAPFWTVTLTDVSNMREEDFLALKKKKKGLKGDGKGSKKKRDREAPTDDAATTAASSIDSWNKWNDEAAAEAPAPAAEVAQACEASTAPPTPTKSSAGFTLGVADQTVVCRDCNSDFIFTVGEQQWFKSKGYEGGKTRCDECTKAKKARFGETTGKGVAAAERAAKTVCYTCGETGHSSKNCKQSTCFNCGVLGHRSKDCKVPRDNRAGGGVCFKFQSGSCTRGADCRFAHILEAAA